LVFYGTLDRPRRHNESEGQQVSSTVFGTTLLWRSTVAHTHTHTHVRLLDERLTDRNLNNDTARPNVSFKMQL